MATRYGRRLVMIAKREITYGTSSAPTGAANAMQISDFSQKPVNAQYVARGLLRPYFGADEELIASVNKEVSFSIEAVGFGTPGLAPAWADVLRACGHSQTLTATERALYLPITDSQDSVTIQVDDNGVLHTLLGARGSVSLDFSLNNVPKLKFKFFGLDGGDTAGSITVASYAAFKQPQLVSDAFTGDLIIGGTMTASGVPAITGGTPYPSTGIEVDVGAKPEHFDLLGGQSIEITDRAVKGKISLDLTAAQEIAFYNSIKAGTLQSVGLVHGTVVGNRFAIFGPAVQFKSPEKKDMKGKRMLDYEVIFTPTAGNDELQIITSF